MSQGSEKDYVLGTHDEEIERLGIQHRVWQPTVLDCWERAGIGKGSRVVDVGAGPGYATMDLAEIIGAGGKVLAVERSARFLNTAAKTCAAKGIMNVRFQEADLMTADIWGENYDATWCRWVASFVASPQTLIKKIAKALRPGGIAIFHEYIAYETFRIAPRRPAMEEFVRKVMESWRAAGGEPNIALELPELLGECGLEIIHATPRVFAVRPGEPMWEWPSSFLEVNLRRLVELGRATPDWCQEGRKDFQAAATDSRTVLTTPMVLEIIARRR